MTSNTNSRPFHCSSANLEPPVLQFSSSSTIKLLVGSQFKLQCLPDLNLMSAEYSWSFTPLLKIDQGVNIHLSPLDHESEELELNPVKLRHAGTYKCVVKGLSELGPMKVKRIFKIEVTGKTGRGNNISVSLYVSSILCDVSIGKRKL